MIMKGKNIENVADFLRDIFKSKKIRIKKHKLDFLEVKLND